MPQIDSESFAKSASWPILRPLRRAAVCLFFVTASVPAMVLVSHPALAKDGAGSGGGHGENGGSGSSGGSGHDGGGSHGGGSSGSSGSGGSGNSGHGSGSSGDAGDGSGHDDDNYASGRRSGDRGSDDRRSDVVWSDRTNGTVELRYADGWSEAVRDSRYTLRDSSRRVVVDRPARRSDRARLEQAMP